MEAGSINHAKWVKKLYIKQPFSDNYVDESFLGELQKNINVACHNYTELLHSSTLLTQHLSAITIFLCVFWAVKTAKMNGTQLVLLANILTLVGYASWMWWIQKDRKHEKQRGNLSKQQLKAAMIFLMVLLGLSPVLKTLTEDTSSDTIASLSLLCFLVNLIFTDYSMHSNPIMQINPMALNAAIFASVLLASRLETRMHVFGLLSLAVNWFGLFPLLRSAIRAALPRIVNSVVTIFMAVATILMCRWLAPNSFTCYALATALITAFIFVSFLAPLWFIKLQRFKNTIHGPWDEARIS